MTRVIELTSILIVFGSVYCDRIPVVHSEFTPDYLDGPYYNDLHCSDVPGCYCSLSGDHYQADCFDPKLSWISPRLSYNITRLNVIGTQLTTLDVNDLVPYVYMRVVEMSYNLNFTTIADGALNGLEQLEKFIIVGNELLEHVSPDIFQQNRHLTYFDGRNNQLKSLPKFAGLPDLTEVIVSGNKIRTIDVSSFDDCLSIHTINLATNKLSDIPTNVFSDTILLRDLDLSVNEIVTLEPGVFTSLSNVENIALRSNKITQLQADVCVDCKALRNLDLSKNNINVISTDAFAGLSALEYLWLNDNNLTVIPSQALNALSTLFLLHMGGNKFNKIPQDALTGQTNLKELFLDGMPTMTQIDIDAFRGLDALSKLGLANNPNLLEFTPEQLPADDLPLLEHLYLNGDGFVYLSETLFTDKINLQYVDLYDNKFNCSCDLKWMPRAVAEEAWASHWVVSGTPPKCYTPQHLNGTSIPMMLEDDMTCEELIMQPVSPTEQTTHLRSSTNFTVRLHKGLPSSKWTTPDNEILIPWPVGEHPLNLRRYASFSLIENNVIESTLILNNASLSDAGNYIVSAVNIVGTKQMQFHLEVLPYELTTTTVAWQTTDIVIGAGTVSGYSGTLLVMTSLLSLGRSILS